MIYNRPRNVDNEWSRWLLQLFHDDIFGMWFPFSLSTRYTPDQLEQRIARLCMQFTKFVFRKRPELTLSTDVATVSAHSFFQRRRMPESHTSTVFSAFHRATGRPGFPEPSVNTVNR